jgi:hypothetical protein
MPVLPESIARSCPTELLKRERDSGCWRRLFTAPTEALTAGWDLSPDGKRFLFIAPPGTDRTLPFTRGAELGCGVKEVKRLKLAQGSQVLDRPRYGK